MKAAFSKPSSLADVFDQNWNCDQQMISDSLAGHNGQEDSVSEKVSILQDSLMNTDRITHGMSKMSSMQHEGGDEVEVEDDVDNIDFNNYKGIYADDDAGQKYTCPITGAHFEPRDLCKRIYKVIDKRKPLEFELYGQPMLVDLVGSSLIAEAPYAPTANNNDVAQVGKKIRSVNQTNSFQQHKGSIGNSQTRQQQPSGSYQVPGTNARAGSMKQQPPTEVTAASQGNSRVVTQGDQPQRIKSMINEAYDGQMNLKDNMGLSQGIPQKKRNPGSIGVQRNQGDFGADVMQAQKAGKQKGNNMSNADAFMSSSMLSEQVEGAQLMPNGRGHAGNQKNIKFKNKFGENNAPTAGKSPQKNQRHATEPSAAIQQPGSAQQMRLMTGVSGGADSSHGRTFQMAGNNLQTDEAHAQQPFNLLTGKLNNGAMQQNSRNHGMGPGSQSLSMHVVGSQGLQPKTFQGGMHQVAHNKATSGGPGFNNNVHMRQSQVVPGAKQPSSRQQTGVGLSGNLMKSFQQASQKQSFAQGPNNQINSKRAASQGQNALQANQRQTTVKPGEQAKSKDAYTLIQEQQRAEQARQPQNQFEHQENIIKQLMGDEIHQKLLQIKVERDALYEQMEAEAAQEDALSRKQRAREASQGSNGFQVDGHLALSGSSRHNQHVQKNSSAEPAIRGHHQANNLSGGPQLLSGSMMNPGGNPYNQQMGQQPNEMMMQSINAKKSQGSMGQQIPLKQNMINGLPGQNGNHLKFQQYVINQQSNSGNQIQNSRNQVLKSGIGGRLNTKNTNAGGQMMTNGSIGARVNTHSSFTGGSTANGNSNIGRGSSNLKQNMSKSIQFQNNFYGQNSSIQQQTSSTSQPKMQSKSGNHSNMNNYQPAQNLQNAGQTSSGKVTKKKAQNLSQVTHNSLMNNTSSGHAKQHQSQISLNNMSLSQQQQQYVKNSFYGQSSGMDKNSGGNTGGQQSGRKIQSSNSATQGRHNAHVKHSTSTSGAALLKQQQPSKNDIIAKYMKTINSSQGANNSQNGQQQVIMSQYNNFMKQMNGNGNISGSASGKLGSNGMSGGQSRNYQNGLQASSKTHTESMIYSGGAGQKPINMSGSFNQGMTSGIHHGHGNSRGAGSGHLAQHSIKGGMNGSTSSIGAVGMHGRPISSYSGKSIGGKKKPSSNLSDPSQGLAGVKQSANVGSFGSQGMHNMSHQTNVVNQSLKPKMIMNNAGSSGGSHTRQMGGAAAVMHQHHGNNGDFHVSNISIGNAPSGLIRGASGGSRPQSSKITKKKAAVQLHGGQQQMSFNEMNGGFQQHQ